MPYELNGVTYQVNPACLELNSLGIKLLAQNRINVYEVRKGTDFSIIEKYEEELQDLHKAYVQVANILEKKEDKEGELTEENTKTYQGQLDSLTKRIEEIRDEYDTDREAQDLLALRRDLDGLAYTMMLRDTKFMHSILDKIIEPSTKAIDLGTQQGEEMCAVLATDFFIHMNVNRKK